MGGMVLGGMRLARPLGKKRVTALGAAIQALAFMVLAGASTFHVQSLVAPDIGLLGLGMGFFTVGGVSLMMDMTHAGQTGLFVGAWTLAQAVAKGLAAVAGGSVHTLAYTLSGDQGLSYALVFLVEGLGMAAALIVLAGVAVHQFRAEVVEMTTLLAEAID
jgi:BCD family chlorophyll transporter-like MFS transporter